MNQDIYFVSLLILLTVGILLLPTEVRRGENSNRVRTVGIVLSIDNSSLEKCGIINTGDQGVTVKIIKGKYKNNIIDANNILMGKLDLDKLFKKDEKVLLALDIDEYGKIINGNAVDHYRINIILLLFILFISALILYGGWTGVKAVLSFIFTGVVVWKILIPGFLNGINPLLLAVFVVMVITFVIIFLIGGLTRRGLVAFIGAISGVIITAILSVIFGHFFKVHGAVKPFSESLLYSGYGNLDLTQIFLAGIFISSSGAVMDIAMDISTSMEELKRESPGITRWKLIMCGLRVGRAVTGTMTTTLLLAYSGSFTALLMVFMAQGTPLMNILNLTYVSAEILQTLVGSFGLVLTAPLTAFIGGFMLCNKPRDITRCSLFR